MEINHILSGISFDLRYDLVADAKKLADVSSCVEGLKRKLLFPPCQLVELPIEVDELCFEFVTDQSIRFIFIARSFDGKIFGSRSLPEMFSHGVRDYLLLLKNSEACSFQNSECFFDILWGESSNSLEEVLFSILNGGAKVSFLEMCGVGIRNNICTEISTNYDQNFFWPHYLRTKHEVEVNKLLEILFYNDKHLQAKSGIYLPFHCGEYSSVRETSLLHKYETSLMKWTEKMKTLVIEKENHNKMDIPGIIQELEFWENYKKNVELVSLQVTSIAATDIGDLFQSKESNYYSAFESVKESVVLACEESADNLKYLELLREETNKFWEADSVEEIVVSLRALVSRIRYIYENSSFYNQLHNLQSLLKTCGQELISKSTQLIDCAVVFCDGQLEGLLESLKTVFFIFHTWRTLVYSHNELSKKRDDNGWANTLSLTLTQTDAFIQRCESISLIAKSKVQFTACADCLLKVLPSSTIPYGGKSQRELKMEFTNAKMKYLSVLQRLHQSVPNLLLYSSHADTDEINVFLGEVKDLELEYQEVVLRICNCCNDTTERVEMLRNISVLVCLHDTRVRVISLFHEQVVALQKYILKLCTLFAHYKAESSDLSEITNKPFYKFRIVAYIRQVDQIKNLLTLFPQDDALEQNLATLRDEVYRLEEMALKRLDVVSADHVQKTAVFSRVHFDQILESPLFHIDTMQKSGIGGGKSSDVNHFLETYATLNFDVNLLQLCAVDLSLKIFSSNMRSPSPESAVSRRKQHLYVLKETYMEAVYLFNTVSRTMLEVASVEQGLFLGRWELIQQNFFKAVKSLTWKTQKGAGFFMTSIEKDANNLIGDINDFVASKKKLYQLFEQIKCVPFFGEVSGSPQSLDAFQLTQENHRSSIRNVLSEINYKIQSNIDHMAANLLNKVEGEVTALQTLNKTKYDSEYPALQHEAVLLSSWRKCCTIWDTELLVVLKAVVRKGLTKFQTLLFGDRKTGLDPQVLFRINVTLDARSVILEPSIADLSLVVNSACQALFLCSSVFNRLTSVYAKGQEKVQCALVSHKSKQDFGLSKVPSDVSLSSSLPRERAPFSTLLCNNQDLLRINMEIMNGIGTSIVEVQKYKAYWEKYKTLWDKKEVSFGSADKLCRSVEAVELEVTRFRGIAREVRREENSFDINSICLDSCPIKQGLIGLCAHWETLTLRLLNTSAEKLLYHFIGKIATVSKQISIQPTNLDELNVVNGVLLNVQAEKSELHKCLPELVEMYSMLEKLGFQVSKDELKHFKGLHSTWTTFEARLNQGQEMILLSKQGLEKSLKYTVRSFENKIDIFKDKAFSSLPYDFTGESAVGSEMIHNLQTELASLESYQKTLSPSLLVFGIEPSQMDALALVRVDLEVLGKIFEVKINWEEQWKQWKDDVFESLILSSMEKTAQEYIKMVNKLGREPGKNGVKGGAKQLKSYIGLKEMVEQFRQTLPLIQDLKNPAIRPRHWKKLEKEIKKEFNPYSKAFTLAAVFSLGLHLHAEFISDLSGNATRELAVEKSLQEIEETWSKTKLDMTQYKGHYHKVRSTEEIFLLLEDNQISISTMKASKFFSSFKDLILKWESILRTMSDNLDLFLQVQRQWMYLESIFVGGEDIKKQLPAEASMFESVNKMYEGVSRKMFQSDTAVEACTPASLLGQLEKMNILLEKIQKSLEQYLETKRQSFPRFYFLSNDDLLEILGQQKNPERVQKHIKKCFAGINSIKLNEVNKGGYKFEATHMVSICGESVVLQVPVALFGPVEIWLNELEAVMFQTVRKEAQSTLLSQKLKKDKWIRMNPGQLLITIGTIVWTEMCGKSIEAVQNTGKKKGLKTALKKQVNYLTKLSEFVRGKLSKVERLKVVALITMEIHNRDVIQKMILSKVSTLDDFNWLSQLRFSWERSLHPAKATSVHEEIPQGSVSSKSHQQENIMPSAPGVIVRQTNQTIEYSYEYQGNNGRLVITPLTDRCILTLVTALSLNRGGAPAGPAGTGKTETVKDLGKNLAKNVVVFNCSDSMDYLSVGKLFSGLAQTGFWGCFDEFNRIQIEVLSVIAQQVLSIMTAIRLKKARFDFMGMEIRCRWSCGIFITMNPGYAGRTELPDNLKSLFRPVSMMVPDLALITEVMLAAEGFGAAQVLAQKTTTLYKLMIQQLSKQDHYDFGLRSLRGVLMCAGALKRENPEQEEELILLTALRDMNVPKFIFEDMKLFMLLINDLFPGKQTPPSEQGILQEVLKTELKGSRLQPIELSVSKAIQLYESKLTRHCNMLVGKTLSGKSVVWNMLKQASSTISLKKEVKTNDFLPVEIFSLNPKSVSMDELYGAFDLATFEWNDGILSNVFRSCAAEGGENIEKWIILDGPVDTLWIESMNTVMDDNKTLTLINGDRINMTASMSLLFEVRDLAVASPATVSRAGMIYLDRDNLGYLPFVQTWVEGIEFFSVDMKTMVLSYFEIYVDPVLTLVVGEKLEPVPAGSFCSVKSCCNLFSCLLAEPSTARAYHENSSENMSEKSKFSENLELLFLSCVAFSISATVHSAGREKVNKILKRIGSSRNVCVPETSIFDSYFDICEGQWKEFSKLVPQGWVPSFKEGFFKIVTPTLDTVRNKFILRKLLVGGHEILVVGSTGTGKSLVIGELLDETLNLTNEAGNSRYVRLVLNFSSTTTSLAVQNIIEESMEKKTKINYAPPGGKHMICFVDDLNMPRKDMFGSQPPLELLRQWIDYNGWYEREKQTWRNIYSMQLLGAMAFPGGGREVISERLQSRFFLYNFTNPSFETMKKIYGTILSSKFENFEPEVKNSLSAVVECMITSFNKISLLFLPSPVKSHYIFTMRDVAKCCQGLLQSDANKMLQRTDLFRVYLHESYRVYGDRFVIMSDVEKLYCLFDEDLQQKCGLGHAEVLEESADTQRVAFNLSYTHLFDEEIFCYREVGNFELLQNLLCEKLEDYNSEPGFIPMNLVLFQDACKYIVRISRVLQQPRGNLLLLGLGGSGRQSLARLSSYLNFQQVFMIEITSNYKYTDFLDDMKSLYTRVGGEGKQVSFLLCDNQITEECFLEAVNNILSSGEIPNLFSKDEKLQCFDFVRAYAKELGRGETADELWSIFIEKCRQNLHVILCISPGEFFRESCRMYPGLVNCTTIIYFHTWPLEALNEVAHHFLLETKISSPNADTTETDRNAELEEEDRNKAKLSRLFSRVHQGVIKDSETMALELKRHNYVTPPNFLELVAKYRKLYSSKLVQLSQARLKLVGGLSKLEEGKEQVQQLSIELEKKKVIVGQAKEECEKLMLVILSEKQAADEQKSKVEAQAKKIQGEEVECQKIAEDAESDLAEAMPLLENAMKEVDKLDKNSISEVKAYSSPPPAVEMVLNAVMLLFQLKPEWATAKKKISEPNFLTQIKAFEKDKVPNKVLAKLVKYTRKTEFTFDNIKAKSSAAATLCVWVLAIEFYCGIYREVLPKKQLLEAAQKKLAVAQSQLKTARDQLAEVIGKVDALNEKYDTSIAQKNRLNAEAVNLESKLKSAADLVDGLGGERERWEQSIIGFEESMKHLIGDVLFSAAFVSYAGPFDSVYRENFKISWETGLKEENLSFSPSFSFKDFLSDPTIVREWNMAGLPNDSFSVENGVMCTTSSRWPLLIDPQGQGNKWLRNQYEAQKLLVCTFKTKDFMRQLENAIQFGQPYLIQDIEEELDPSIEPVLSKAVIKVGNVEVLRLGEKEISYNREFCFFLTTKLNNPHYRPEVSTKVTIINFTVKPEGLEDQLLMEVIKIEKPELEAQKAELTITVAEGKNTLVALENSILKSLAETEGSLLDDDDLIATLQVSKQTSKDVSNQLKVSQETEVEIDKTREGYREAASRASLLYFVLNDLSSVDPMYQFSLVVYAELFQSSVSKSRSSSKVSEEEAQVRVDEINSYHTYAVYCYTCRGLFERHKLLFSLQICFNLLKVQGQVRTEELNFLLKGGVVLDKTNQMENPAPEIFTEQQWDSLTELATLFESFSSIDKSVTKQIKDWKQWFLASKPEEEKLPGDWENKLSSLQKLLIIRSLRLDRCLPALATFVSSSMGEKFIEPPPLNLDEVFLASSSTTPLVFVLSPGVDPTKMVYDLAASCNKTLADCSLGQGQAPIAAKLVKDALVKGTWVLLSNCHLAGSWLPSLEVIIENYCELSKKQPTAVHKAFRLWLSSTPISNFPLNILQRGLKMTTEPPKGLKANLRRLYGLISEDTFESIHEPLVKAKYKKLVFCLAWFHSLLLERRKFLTLGWNIPYGFNDADFLICENIVRMYVSQYPDRTPWDAIRYLIAQANYGGRITDDWDRRLCSTYVQDLFNDNAVEEDNFRVCIHPSLSHYHIPDDGKMKIHVQYISQLPIADDPECFGQHPNADMSSMITNSEITLGTLLALQPQDSISGKDSQEEKAAGVIQDLASKISAPKSFDPVSLKSIVSAKIDPDPYKSVLLQEVDRYSGLLKVVLETLGKISAGLKGQAIITASLEEILDGILHGKLPSAWNTCFPSLKPLASWVKDLNQRLKFFDSWLTGDMPSSFWLGGFTYPSGFLTALLQTTARKEALSIDSLGWDFVVSKVDGSQDPNQFKLPRIRPSEGAYMYAIYLEGARWSYDCASLVDALPLELLASLPVTHFKPVKLKQQKTKKKKVYSCPCYLYPIRTGTRERPSFTITVNLNAGDSTPEHWIKRGTALLLSTAL
eukprot:maker-scaffold_6-snap-gene-17.26-mRNA-1 protein AED:0.02 eAED:0.02 QI:0/0/0/1/0.75/0.6/5/0/4681